MGNILKCRKKYVGKIKSKCNEGPSLLEKAKWKRKSKHGGHITPRSITHWGGKEPVA